MLFVSLNKKMIARVLRGGLDFVLGRPWQFAVGKVKWQLVVVW
jgi:hypothetical protein